MNSNQRFNVVYDLDPDSNLLQQLYPDANVSQYYTVDEFNEISHSAENVLLLNYNIRSVYRNIDSFIVLLNSILRCPDIIVATFRNVVRRKT